MVKILEFLLWVKILGTAGLQFPGLVKILGTAGLQFPGLVKILEILIFVSRCAT